MSHDKNNSGSADGVSRRGFIQTSAATAAAAGAVASFAAPAPARAAGANGRIRIGSSVPADEVLAPT
jgi:hypothetical protein